MTKIGRWLYAAGGNAEAARLSGINIRALQDRRVRLQRVRGGGRRGNPDLADGTAIAGDGLLRRRLPRDGRRIVGGTSILGGRGAIWRTMLGVPSSSSSSATASTCSRSTRTTRTSSGARSSWSPSRSTRSRAARHERGSAGSFDYVVVGAGSGGSVVARRLVDAGAARWPWSRPAGAASNPAIHDPGRWCRAVGGRRWTGATRPSRSAACADRALAWPRGRVLGGPSALNGMIYMRGHRLDYDGWACRVRTAGASTTSCRSSSAPRTSTAGRPSTTVREGRCA